MICRDYIRQDPRRAADLDTTGPSTLRLVPSPCVIRIYPNSEHQMSMNCLTFNLLRLNLIITAQN
jgi:hypothetical protein